MLAFLLFAGRHISHIHTIDLRNVAGNRLVNVMVDGTLLIFPFPFPFIFFSFFQCLRHVNGLFLSEPDLYSRLLSECRLAETAVVMRDPWNLIRLIPAKGTRVGFSRVLSEGCCILFYWRFMRDTACISLFVTDSTGRIR